MQLHEIKDIYLGDHLYENLMANDELLVEGAKELFAAGKEKMGQAADKLKDAVDAPAQKAWAEVQSRLATAGKDDAIGKLKAFASKHKVAIGTMAIIGAGLLTATDASAGDAVQAGAGAAADFAGGGIDIMQDVLSSIDKAGGGIDISDIQNVQVKGMSAEEYAKLASKSVNNAVGSSRIDMRAAAIDNITQAVMDAVGQGKGAATSVADAGDAVGTASVTSQGVEGGGSQSSMRDIFGNEKKVNWGKGQTDTMKQAGEFMKGRK